MPLTLTLNLPFLSIHSKVGAAVGSKVVGAVVGSKVVGGAVGSSVGHVSQDTGHKSSTNLLPFFNLFSQKSCLAQVLQFNLLGSPLILSVPFLSLHFLARRRSSSSTLSFWLLILPLMVAASAVIRTMTARMSRSCFESILVLVLWWYVLDYDYNSVRISNLYRKMLLKLRED